MSYKTIAVNVDGAGQAGPRIALAARLAKAHGAHLIGLATTGLAATLHQAMAAVDNAEALADIAALHARAADELRRFEKLARAAGVESVESRLLEDEIAAGFVGAAMCADLAVVGQVAPERDPDRNTAPDLPEQVVVHSGVPVLIIPYIGAPETVGRHVLVGWSATPESARALRSAIPILRRSERVTIAMFEGGLHARQASAGLPAWLARHGIEADITLQATEGGVADALLSMADNRGCDLLVVGSYGHSRLRQFAVGGNTHTVLASATIPVLTSH